MEAAVTKIAALVHFCGGFLWLLGSYCTPLQSLEKQNSTQKADRPNCTAYFGLTSQDAFALV